MKSICSADHIKGYKKNPLAQTEHNDCVVRAIASTFGFEYNVAHKFVAEEFGRKQGKGTFGTSLKLSKRAHILGKSYRVLDKKDITYPGSARHQSLGGKPVEVTLRVFLERFSKGKYLVIVKGHAFSIIDGVVIGNASDGKRLRAKILFAIKVEE
jgi:hypothetical protein